MRWLNPRVLAMFALFALLTALLSATPVAARMGGGSAGSVAGVDARTLYDRVHFLGASASAGFGVRAPLPSGHPGRSQAMPLSRIATAARLQPCTVTGDATSLFFTNPIATGSAQVNAVLAAAQKPTLVIGVDCLFWYVYGALDADRARIKDESQRMAMLEVGLANLDRIVKANTPVVVGDFPNMSDAVGKMLSPSQMPALETLDAANKRLRAWAAERPLVTIVPLAALVKQLDSGEPFQAGNRTWSSKADGPLIQADRLHPTFAGSVALLARTEQSASEHFRKGEAPGLTPAAMEHDPVKVGATARANIEAEIARRSVPAGEPR
ncbi:MAG: hypothetical protein JNK53_01150 [Phycisphaerae bacterium]|nr:hypothetical protein [Phycisphaerae bacterium]